MNLEIAKQRINEVLRPDTMTTTREDFLATHVPLNNIELYSKFDPNDYSKSVKFEEAKSEEDVLQQFIMNPGDKHQFVLVMGESGAGKSHLIRWFNERLQNESPEDEVILFVRRSDNTLKGTIKQLLEKPEIANIGNREVYKRLVEATAVVDEDKLKGEILSKFILEVESDQDEEYDQNEEDFENDKSNLSHNDKRKLVAFLKYKKIQNKLKQVDGPIDRIYLKVAQSGKVASDIDALFVAEDFDLDDEEMEEIEDNADKDTIKMARKLCLNPEKKAQIATYLNRFIDIVIQRCSGLEAGDFEEIFKDIRREIKKSDKHLTILIEDITSFTGVNAALLNSLTTEHTGYGNDDLCRISSVVGITSGYLKDVFKTNYRDRVSLYVNLPNDIFDEEYLYEFVTKYLNTMSLQSQVISNWVKGGALPKEYPVHECTDEKKWGVFEDRQGKKLPLYPFTKAAIRNLYAFRLSKNELRTPRYILQYIIEPVVKDILFRKNNFPNLELKPYNNNASNTLRQKIFSMPNFDENIKERLYLFMCMWGTAEDTLEFDANNKKIICGIYEDVYAELGLPIIANMREVKTKSNEVKGNTSSGIATKVKKEAVTKDNVAKGEINKPVKVSSITKIERALDTLEKWVSGSAINVGATTDNVVLLSNARDDINKYLIGAINWQTEGVSLDNLRRISGSKTKDKLVGFENQTAGQDKHLYLMPANRESQTIIEAFVRWAVEGGESWNFENGDYFALRVQIWTEKIKSDLVHAINYVENNRIVYYKYAMAFDIYRQILCGQLNTNWESYSSNIFIGNDLCKIEENTYHSANWNKVLKLFTTLDRDKTAREVVLQYFNLEQGQSKGKLYLDRGKLDKTFLELKQIELNLETEEYDFKDCIATREEFKTKYFQVIASKIEDMFDSEFTLIKAEKELLESLLGSLDITAEEILEFAESAKQFYDRVNEAKLFAQYDAALINSVKESRKDISEAIKTLCNILESKNRMDSLIMMSFAPLEKIADFKKLIIKINSDVLSVEKEIKNRSVAFAEQLGNTSVFPYKSESDMISECEKLLKEVMKNEDN